MIKDVIGALLFVILVITGFGCRWKFKKMTHRPLSLREIWDQMLAQQGLLQFRQCDPDPTLPYSIERFQALGRLCHCDYYRETAFDAETITIQPLNHEGKLTAIFDGGKVTGWKTPQEKHFRCRVATNVLSSETQILEGLLKICRHRTNHQKRAAG